QALQCVAEVLPTNRRIEHDRLEPRVVFAHDALEGKLTECTSHGSLTDAVSEKEPTVLRPLVARTRNIMQGDFSQSDAPPLESSVRSEAHPAHPHEIEAVGASAHAIV